MPWRSASNTESLARSRRIRFSFGGIAVKDATKG
jgi:hypothetical protein